MIKYVFFDLDATLIDIKRAQNIAGEYMYNFYGFNECTDLEKFLKKWDELTDYHYSFYTRKEISYEEQRVRRVRDLFNYFGIEMNTSELEIYDIYLKTFEDGWCLFDDVKEVISNLYNKGYKLGVISNGDLKQQTQKLERTGILEYMMDVSTSSEYTFSKPSIKLYETVCRKNNIKYDELCYVGDSLKKDVLPCLELGIHAVWLNRQGKDLPQDNIIQIRSLKELSSILIQLNDKL